MAIVNGTTIATKPGFVPTAGSSSYDGQMVRLATLGNALPGLFERGHLAVTQRAAGANMSVDVAAGQAFVDPRTVALQGVYLAHFPAATNTATDHGITWTAADGSNPRIDLLCVEVQDLDFSGSFTGARLVLVTGTPAAGATHQLNVTNWPAVPTGLVPIAAIRIPASDTTIGTAEITNLNPIGGARATYQPPNSTAETTISTTYARLATPDFVCVYVPHAYARIRVFSEGWWKISSASGTQGITLFLNDTQLKYRTDTNAAPASGGRELTLATFHSRFITSDRAFNSATGQFYATVAGVTADVSDVTTGVAGLGLTSTGGEVGAIEITQLAAGWYVIEQRYKTSANTLTVDERRMWAEVIG